MHRIELTNFDRTYTLCQPAQVKSIDANSPASEIVTCFTKTRPRMLEKDISVDDAKYMMLKEHVKLKIVIDKNEQMIGAVTFADLTDEKSIILMHDREKRSDILVEDVMTPSANLKAISREELEHCSIKDVIHLLKDEHLNYIFLVNSEKKQVLGIISASDIARKLKIPLVIDSGITFHSIFKSS
jgi:CBS-domain-containing membrane protein